MNQRTSSRSVEAVTVESATEQAVKIVVARGKAYKYKNCNHVSVVVFSRSLTEIDKLIRSFGGNWYKHLGGFLWVLGKKEDQTRMMSLVLPHIDEDHKLRGLAP